MATTNEAQTVQRALNVANPQDLASACQKGKLGNALSPVKAVVTSLTATATPDITSASVKAAAVISGITLKTGQTLPAIGHIVSLRVATSGTAASVGTYIATDDSGTAIVPPGGASAAVGIAKLSDDGKTLTFPNTVTGFTIVYFPRLENLLVDLAPSI
jgi:hypothetical protein